MNDNEMSIGTSLSATFAFIMGLGFMVSLHVYPDMHHPAGYIFSSMLLGSLASLPIFGVIGLLGFLVSSEDNDDDLPKNDDIRNFKITTGGELYSVADSEVVFVKNRNDRKASHDYVFMLKAPNGKYWMFSHYTFRNDTYMKPRQNMWVLDESQGSFDMVANSFDHELALEWKEMLKEKPVNQLFASV